MIFLHRNGAKNAFFAPHDIIDGFPADKDCPLFQRFLLLVPSLSWQMIAFQLIYVKNGDKHGVSAPRRLVVVEPEVGNVIACENGLLLSAFPMFVPSLSW